LEHSVCWLLYLVLARITIVVMRVHLTYYIIIIIIIMLLCRRFSGYSGALLSQFVRFQHHSPDALFNTLSRDNFSTDDILKLSHALSQLT